MTGTGIRVVGAMALFGVAVLSGVLYVNWLNAHDAIYYHAVERGQQAVYPAGHFVTGFITATALVLSVASLLVSSMFSTAGNRIRQSPAKIVWLLASGLIIGVSLPVSFESLFLGAPILLAGLAALSGLWCYVRIRPDAISPAGSTR